GISRSTSYGSLLTIPATPPPCDHSASCTSRTLRLIAHWVCWMRFMLSRTTRAPLNRGGLSPGLTGLNRGCLWYIYPPPRPSSSQSAGGMTNGNSIGDSNSNCSCRLASSPDTSGSRLTFQVFFFPTLVTTNHPVVWTWANKNPPICALSSC